MNHLHLAAPLLLAAAFSSACKHSESNARPSHYLLDLAITEGGTTKHTSFTLDVSEREPASVTIGKNVTLGTSSARSDVGVKLTARIDRKGGDAVVDADASISTVDAAGKVRRMKGRGLMPVAPGSTVTLMDGSDDGIWYRLTATPISSASVGASVPSAGGPHVVDVVAMQSRAGAVVKRTALSLTLTGDAPSTVTTGESVPLTAASFGAPRQDTGVRVKASALPHEKGLALDFDLELSAVEPGATGATVRKLHAHGPVLASFDQTTTAFVAEEDGNRYEVTVLPHRASR